MPQNPPFAPENPSLGASASASANEIAAGVAKAAAPSEGVAMGLTGPTGAAEAKALAAQAENLGALVAGVKAANWEEASEAFERVDWGMDDAASKRLWVVFWRDFPPAVAFRERLQNDESPRPAGFDGGLAEKIAKNASFLAALKEAIHAQGMPAAALLASPLMARLALAAMKAHGEAEGARRARWLAKEALNRSVSVAEMSRFAEHGFDLSSGAGRRWKLHALDQWLKRGASAPEAGAASRVDSGARRAAAAASLEWLERNGWVEPEDYAEKIDIESLKRDSRAGNAVRPEEALAANTARAIGCRVLLERMGKQATQHPLWSSWAQGLARRAEHNLAKGPSPEWEALAAWLQAAELAVEANLGASQGAGDAKKKPRIL